LACPILSADRAHTEPHFFAEDFRFIRYLGAATGWREVNSEVVSFQDVNRARRSFFRINFRLRVSGRRAAVLAERVFSARRRKGTAELATGR
jgi:hypothetical protein